MDFQSACDSQFRGERKILTLVQKNKKQKKKKKKKIYQTGARDRIELAVRCERLLHVEGLTVTLRCERLLHVEGLTVTLR